MRIRRDIDFEKLWSVLGECYNSLCIRCLAFKKDEMIVGNKTTILLSKRNRDKVEKEVESDYENIKEMSVIDIDDIVLLYDVKDANKAPEFYKTLQTGRITLKNHVVEIGEYDENQKPTIREETYLRLRHEKYPIIEYIPRFKAIDIESILNDVENRLYTLGIYSLNEIGFQWLELPNMREITYDVLLAFPIYFEQVHLPKLYGNTFYSTFKLHKNLRDKLNLLLTLRRKKNSYEVTIENKSYSFSDLTCQKDNEDDDFVICEVNHKFKKSVSIEDTIRFRVSCDLGILLEDYESVKTLRAERVKEPYLKILQHQVDGIEEFEQIIKGKIENIGSGKTLKGDEAFQRVVCWILSVSGFKVLEFGGTKYAKVKTRDGVDIGDIDIVAQDIEKKITYVIDCTVSAEKVKLKIDPIANIAERLNEDLKIHIEPLVFCRETATTAKDNPRSVGVVDKEDLINILNALRKGKPNDAKKIIARQR